MNITSRFNDLDGFFYPIIYFIKDQILNHRIFPLWNTMILSGTPLLPDPQSTLFYLPNILFLIFPINFTFILMFVIHGLISGIFIFLISREFKFNRLISFFLALSYILSPKLSGLVEAGHYGLVISYDLLPIVFYSSLLLSKKFSKKVFVLLIISLISIFLNHTVTFLVAILGLFGFFLTLFLSSKQKRHLWIPILALAFSFGLIAFVLLPQADWSKDTTRLLLITHPDLYPKWTGMKEFLVDIFIPWLHGQNYLWNIDTEKWITAGLILPVLSLLGLIRLKLLYKIALLISTGLIILITLNNLSPIYPILKSSLFSTIRVTTRFWLILNLAIIFLAGLELQHLYQKNKIFSYILMTIATLEVLSLSYLRISKPIDQNINYVPDQVYRFLKEDSDTYRVFCITRCIPQKKAAENHLELVEGYNTLAQLNYYQEVWQFTGQYWNYYTLSIPPFGTINFEKIKPDSYALGLYNVKYIISPYPLNYPDLILKQTYSGFNIYQNNDFLPRSYLWSNKKFVAPATIINSTPNEVVVDTSTNRSDQLILSQTYNKDWKAYLNGQKQVKLQETPDNLPLVDLEPDTTFVDFKYEPDSLKIGTVITLLSMLSLIIWLRLKTVR